MAVNFYTFSFRNPGRKARMTERFEKEGLTLEFVEPVELTDSRVFPAPPDHRRTWAIMLNHMDMLKTFLESDADYGIFCEDDILVRKDFSMHLPHIIRDFADLKLDVLLLSYLIN
jgi:hypothetical protein